MEQVRATGRCLPNYVITWSVWMTWLAVKNADVGSKYRLTRAWHSFRFWTLSYAGYLIQADVPGSPAIISRNELFLAFSPFSSVVDAVVPWSGTYCTASIYDRAGTAVP